MQKTSLLFWILGIGLTLLAVYESMFPSSPGTLFVRLFGLAALFFTCVSLLIGPLMVHWPARFAALIEPRRAVGLTAFVFMLAHFGMAIVHSFGGEIELILESTETVIAIPALLLFTAVALVSSDFALRKLGNARWKTIQRLTYGAFALTLIHFFLSQNGVLVLLGDGTVFINLAEGFIWLLVSITIVLQVAGFWTKRKRAPPVPPAPLTGSLSSTPSASSTTPGPSIP